MGLRPVPEAEEQVVEDGPYMIRNHYWAHVQK